MKRTRRTGDLVRVGLASLGLLLASLFSTGNQISALERHVFRVVNGLSGAASPVLYAVMQAGNFVAVFVAAGLALAARRRPLALALVVGGTAAWLLAKAVKLGHRARPAGRAAAGCRVPRARIAGSRVSRPGTRPSPP